MFLEIWMIVLLVVLSGLWGEYRARMGWYKGKEDMVKLYQNVIQDAMTEDFQREREKGAAACLFALMKLGMIKIDKDGILRSVEKEISLKEAEELKLKGWQE